ncbi:MAG: tandem-95 repeat protein, partial [Planctomycetota bacterium]
GSGRVAADIRIGFFAASPKAQALLFLQGYDLLEAAVNYALGTTAGVKACNASSADGGGVMIQEDTVASITLGGSDLDGDSLIYNVVTGPSHGCLKGTAPNLIYTPKANFNGSDSFTFKANDGTTDSALATVLITVTAVSDPPRANDDSVTIQEDTLAPITLAGSDLDGDPLTYSVLTGPCHGWLNGTAPNLIYTPKVNFNGSDSFTFKVNDGTADSAAATVSITVTAVNDPPGTSYNSATTQCDRPVLTIDVLVNDTDVDNEPLTVTAVTQDSEGPAAIKTDSTLSCAPDINVCGTDVVTDTCSEGPAAIKTDSTLSCAPEINVCGTDVVTDPCSEGEGETYITIVKIPVKVVNDEPVITSIPVTEVIVGELYAYDVNATDADVGDTLTYSLTAKPAGMTIEPDTGLIQWAPNGADAGNNDIVVKVVDSCNIPASDTQSFTITVNPVSLPAITTLIIADGYDQKDQKTLSADGKTDLVQASNSRWWETEFDSYTSYDFSDVSIPAGATIASVVIYVEHFEEKHFSSGKLQWGIGMGWPSNPVVWASTEAPVRQEQCNEAIDSWDVTSFVDTDEKMNSLQLQIKNNDNVAKRKTLVNYIYAVVKWY